MIHTQCNCDTIFVFKLQPTQYNKSKAKLPFSLSASQVLSALALLVMLQLSLLTGLEYTGSAVAGFICDSVPFCLSAGISSYIPVFVGMFFSGSLNSIVARSGNVCPFCFSACKTKNFNVSVQHVYAKIKAVL